MKRKIFVQLQTYAFIIETRDEWPSYLTAHRPNRSNRSHLGKGRFAVGKEKRPKRNFKSRPEVATPAAISDNVYSKECDTWFTAPATWRTRFLIWIRAVWHTGRVWHGIGSSVKWFCVIGLGVCPGILSWAEFDEKSTVTHKIVAVAVIVLSATAALYLGLYDELAKWRRRKAVDPAKSAMTEASFRLSHSVTKLAEKVFIQDGNDGLIADALDQLCIAIRDASRIKLRAPNDDLQVNIFLFDNETGTTMRVKARARRTGNTVELPFQAKGSMPYHCVVCRRPCVVHDCQNGHPFKVPEECKKRSKYLMPMLMSTQNEIFSVGAVSVESSVPYRFARIDREAFDSTLMPYISFIKAMMWNRTHKIRI